MKTTSIIIAIVAFFTGCKMNVSNNKEQYRLYPEKNDLLQDSCFVEINHFPDSIRISYNLTFKDGRVWKLKQQFIQDKGQFYEKKEIFDFKRTVISTDKVLSFATSKDTNFVYEHDQEKFPQTTPKGFDDWKYELHKNGELYCLKRTKLYDSLTIENIFYDKEYNITEIQIHWHEKNLIFKK